MNVIGKEDSWNNGFSAASGVGLLLHAVYHLRVYSGESSDLDSLLPLLPSNRGLLGQAVYVLSRGANHRATPTILVSHTRDHKKSTRAGGAGGPGEISPTSRSQTWVLLG